MLRKKHRKVISEEIEEVLKKKRNLQLSIEELLKDADTLADKAETKSDLLMLGRSNDLRRLSIAKKLEIDELININ